MRGRAREMFVRSTKAIVYMTNATGMIRVQREGAGFVEGAEGGVFAGSMTGKAKPTG